MTSQLKEHLDVLVIEDPQFLKSLNDLRDWANTNRDKFKANRTRFEWLQSFEATLKCLPLLNIIRTHIEDYPPKYVFIFHLLDHSVWSATATRYMDIIPFEIPGDTVIGARPVKLGQVIHLGEHGVFLSKGFSFIVLTDKTVKIPSD